MGFLASNKLVFSCLAISIACCEVAEWLERNSILTTCQEERKYLNGLMHQETASTVTQ